MDNSFRPQIANKIATNDVADDSSYNNDAYSSQLVFMDNRLTALAKVIFQQLQYKYEQYGMATFNISGLAKFNRSSRSLVVNTIEALTECGYLSVSVDADDIYSYELSGAEDVIGEPIKHGENVVDFHEFKQKRKAGKR